MFYVVRLSTFKQLINRSAQWFANPWLSWWMKINVIALNTGYFNFYTFYYFTLFFTLIRSLTKTEKFPLWHWVKKDNFGALKRPYIINQYRTKELPQVPSSFLIVNQYHNFHPNSRITEYDFSSSKSTYSNYFQCGLQLFSFLDYTKTLEMFVSAV